MTLFNAAPEFEYQIDFAPSDYVASAIAELVARGAAPNETLHLIGPRRTTVAEVADWMRAAGYRLENVNQSAGQSSLRASRFLAQKILLRAWPACFHLAKPAREPAPRWWHRVGCPRSTLPKPFAISDRMG